MQVLPCYNKNTDSFPTFEINLTQQPLNYSERYIIKNDNSSYKLSDSEEEKSQDFISKELHELDNEGIDDPDISDEVKSKIAQFDSDLSDLSDKALAELIKESSPTPDIENARIQKLEYRYKEVYEGQTISSHKDEDLVETFYRRPLRHGYGKYFYKKGAIYEGQWNLSYKEGAGRMIYPNKSYYIGQYFKGNRKGFGKEIKRDQQGDLIEVYIGNWKHDKRHGKGTLWDANGSMYQGTFRKNFCNGKAIYTTTKGGQFKCNLDHGKLISYSILDDPDYSVSYEPSEIQ
ncbi:unnamed protein product [Moneuplotes crassus]|uniref:MORN repeat protein n=1 Tax=Euplotes crassus TaxID=5936 RepID=A0AAD1XIG9_EUPCR|nr:unnamed protein product [Moneuplotes crassus]